MNHRLSTRMFFDQDESVKMTESSQLTVG